jgi:hypothetical protein
VNLFGQTLDGQQLFGLISLLALLAFWMVALKNERGQIRWFRQWEAARKARRDAEEAGGAAPSQPSRRFGGPWG